MSKPTYTISPIPTVTEIATQVTVMQQQEVTTLDRPSATTITKQVTTAITALTQFITRVTTQPQKVMSLSIATTTVIPVMVLATMSPAMATMV